MLTIAAKKKHRGIKLNPVERVGMAVVYLICIMAGILTIVPFLYIVAGSFATEKELVERAFFIIPHTFSLNAYKYIIADGSIFSGGNAIEAAMSLEAAGADAVGINCSTGPDQLESLVRNMRQAAKVPLLVKPNAGMPEISPEGEAIYSMGPAAFAQHMRTLIDAGAALVGGCCGTDPRYISALRDVLPR